MVHHNPAETVRALFAGFPDYSMIFLIVAFVVTVALFVGMAVAGRGH